MTVITDRGVTSNRTVNVDYLRQRYFVGSLRRARFLPFRYVHSSTRRYFSNCILPVRVVTSDPSRHALVPLRRRTKDFRLHRRQFMEASKASRDAHLRAAIRTVGSDFPFHRVVKRDYFGLRHSNFVHGRAELPRDRVQGVPAWTVRLRRFVVRLFIVHFFFHFLALLFRFLREYNYDEEEASRWSNGEPHRQES